MRIDDRNQQKTQQNEMKQENIANIFFYKYILNESTNPRQKPNKKKSKIYELFM